MGVERGASSTYFQLVFERALFSLLIVVRGYGVPSAFGAVPLRDPARLADWPYFERFTKAYFEVGSFLERDPCPT